VPRDRLPKDQQPKEGMMLALSTPDGKHLPGMITGVTDKEITIDLNHPLAGKNLNFKLKVVEVSPSPS
jgi:FKBP-type peptidyl-prolyl cis-trans isomerase 2